jgi:C1A family cysteine protease
MTIQNQPLLANSREFKELPYVPAGTPLQKMVDLRSWDTQVEEQGNLGSCTANAVVGMYEMLLKHEKNYELYLSRLFVYYNSRLLEETVSSDSGAYLADVIRAVSHYGICAEVLWPYRVDNFAVKPSEDCYADGLKRTIKDYYKLSKLSDILDALNHNRLVAIGFEVFENFKELESPYTLALPQSNQLAIAGHALFLVGYDLDKKLLLAKNSFGSNWADHGYCWISFDYAIAYIVDMWTFDINMAY